MLPRGPPYLGRGWGLLCRACSPAPAVVPAAGRQPQKQQPKQQQKLAYWGMAGWVRLRGTP
ncbi:hypothetical protein E4420_10450 [Stenotrophomonas maltophilia]|nr:hypothetical protein EGY09_02855 [Stenotrophomonas maltophilia]MBA0232468.1 hypothetical protein [Stenotrophomonas maltophilia]MBA0295531.1 hypothetical protein [Stenotrophomonas maltophilia]MBA0348849.1 hypothetical protein [Stenotrophomonas maltophilia]MBA0376956.1 hypothetical protein [Stenotrophomonas maltophilia]